MRGPGAVVRGVKREMGRESDGWVGMMWIRQPPELRGRGTGGGRPVVRWIGGGRQSSGGGGEEGAGGKEQKPPVVALTEADKVLMVLSDMSLLAAAKELVARKKARMVEL